MNHIQQKLNKIADSFTSYASFTTTIDKIQNGLDSPESDKPAAFHMKNLLLDEMSDTIAEIAILMKEIRKM